MISLDGSWKITVNKQINHIPVFYFNKKYVLIKEKLIIWFVLSHKKY